MKPRHKRLTLIVGGLAVLGVAAALVLSAFQQNLVFFYQSVAGRQQGSAAGQGVQSRRMVEQGSLKRQSDGLTVSFNVTDTAKVIPVVYIGILPDLFKEGKGVVAQGKLGEDGVFRAHEVLAKHDENYTPPEAAYAVEQAQKARKTLQ